VRVGGMPSGCKDPADALLMNKGDPSVFLQSAVIDALPWQEWCVRFLYSRDIVSQYQILFSRIQINSKSAALKRTKE